MAWVSDTEVRNVHTVDEAFLAVGFRFAFLWAGDAAGAAFASAARTNGAASVERAEPKSGCSPS